MLCELHIYQYFKNTHFMKQILSIIFILFSCMPEVNSQDLTMQTAMVSEDLTIISPTCNNLLKLIKADTAEFSAIAKKYNYHQSSGGSEWYYAKNTFKYALFKLKLKVSVVMMNFAGSEEDMKALQSSILVRFPGVKPKITDDGGSFHNNYEVDKDKNGLAQYSISTKGSAAKGFEVMIYKL